MVLQKKHRRMIMFVICAALLIAGVWIVLSALKQNSQFFYNASDVAADGFVPESETFRIGGLVKDGTVETTGITTKFEIIDFERDMQTPLYVVYSGALPDLFREGQGVVVSGRLLGRREFVADSVLAKHDENYQPEINYKDAKK